MAEQIVRQPATSAAQKHFSAVPTADVQRSTFDRSHGWKSTIETSGQLVPIYWDEILPGDTLSINASIFCRLATPLKPIMDNIKIDCHFFFVPNRLIWSHWRVFMGEEAFIGADPDDYTVPQVRVNLGDVATFGSLTDYLGLPVGLPDTSKDHWVEVNALPYRAYDLIFYEWYRDENLLIENRPYEGNDTVTEAAGGNVRHRAKRKDYFTSCLPWPQKGDPVVIPIGETAPVRGKAGDSGVRWSIGGQNNQKVGSKPGGDAASVDFENYTNNSSWQQATWSTATGLEVDLQGATAATINDLRTAFQIQRLLERDARGGTRYIEMVLAHFGVQNPDFRLFRPEYLGKASGMLNINPVAATVTTDDAPQANLAATGTGLAKGGFTHSFTEHGIVMGIMSMRADVTYQQGIERYWSRKTRYDFYLPVLAHLGEQAVLNKEVYFSDAPADDEVFGYQERWGEMRFKPGRVCGEFRSNHPTSLDTWHLAQDFEALPALNQQFVGELPPMERILAVPSEPDYLVDAWFNVKHTRPMPVYSVPGYMDHF